MKFRLACQVLMLSLVLIPNLARAADSQFPPAQPIKDVEADLQADRLAQVERIMLHLNAGEKDTAMIPEVYAEDVVFIDPLFPEGLHGRSPLIQYHTALNAMIESFVVRVKEVQQMGDDVLVYWDATATLQVKVDLTEALKGLPTFGHKLEVNGMKIGPVSYDGMSRFSFAEDSRLVRYHKDYYDSLPQYKAIPGLRQVLTIIEQQNRKGLLPSKPARLRTQRPS